MASRPPEVTADREPLEVPGHVLAQVGAAAGFAHQSGQQLGVPADHGHHLAERPAACGSAGRRTRRQDHGTARAGRGSRGPTTTPSAPVSLIIRSASDGLPDVAVAEHRDADVALQGGDRGPVGVAGVGLLGRTPVQRDRRATRLLGDPAGVQEGLMIMVDADPGLDRHRYAVRPARRGPWPPGSSAAGPACTAAPLPRPCGSPWAPGSRSSGRRARRAYSLHKISVACAMIVGSTP